MGSLLSLEHGFMFTLADTRDKQGMHFSPVDLQPEAMCERRKMRKTRSKEGNKLVTRSIYKVHHTVNLRGNFSLLNVGLSDVSFRKLLEV